VIEQAFSFASFRARIAKEWQRQREVPTWIVGNADKSVSYQYAIRLVAYMAQPCGFSRI
jgi:hypothetical protein